MTKAEFLLLLKGSSLIAIKFAERYVKNKLTTNFKYNVILNASQDDTELSQFETYLEDNGIIILDLKDREVADLLCRNNKVPVWIDINVLKSSKKTTTFNLLCSGRYSDKVDEYYYNKQGSGPFGIKSPKLPIHYKEGNKFKL